MKFLISAPDGTQWDGTQKLVFKRETYHPDIRTLVIKNPVEGMAATGNETKVFHEGDVVNVLGWVRRSKVENENRFWVDEDGYIFSVRATGERPV